MKPTAAALSIIDGNASAIDSVMAVMDTAFDPDFGEAWRRDQCLGILGMPGVWLALGLDDGQTAGFALTRIIADEAELLLIAVKPEMHGLGIGALLLQNVIERVAREGAVRLHLEMRDGNPALDLYRRFGFTPVGRRHGYYRGKFGQSFDAVTLTHVL